MRPLLEALDEFFDVVEDQLGRFVERGNVGTGKLDELRVRDVIRDVARPSEGPRRQSGARNHQSGDTDLRQYVARVKCFEFGKALQHSAG